MTRLSPPSRWALALACVAMSGCLRRAPSPAEAIAPPIGQPSGEESELLEVRTLKVYWADAEGAPSRITRTETDARERARTISALLRAPGSNFGEVAREYGDTAPVVQRMAQDDSRLFRVAASLRVGEVSRPVRTDGGFVVMVRRDDPLSGPSSVAARHILIAYAGARRASDTVTRTREEARELAEQVRTEASAGADWVALHREHTDEPGSPPGGDLGTFGRGQMVPSFERAVFSMEAGATSEVVETPFGFHVIQRVE